MPESRRRPDLEIIAGTPPGGGQDRTARAVASVLGPSVRVTNVPGRGGGNGWDRLFARGGDPSVVGVSSPTLITNRLLGTSNIDDRDLTVIAMLYTEYGVAVAPVGSRWLEPATLLNGIADGAVTVSFATARGNANHLALAAIARHAGVDIGTLALRVFDSARLAIEDLLAGGADFALVSAASAAPELTDGALSSVGVTAPTRLGGVLSGTPTFQELGIQCDIGMWRGLVGPPGLSTSAVEALCDDLAAATASPGWEQRLREHLWVDLFKGPGDSEQFLEDERGRLLAMLDLAGVLTEVEHG